MGPSELKQERSCGQGLTELWSLESLESHWGSGSPTLVPDDQCDTEGKGSSPSFCTEHSLALVLWGIHRPQSRFCVVRGGRDQQEVGQGAALEAVVRSSACRLHPGCQARSTLYGQHPVRTCSGSPTKSLTQPHSLKLPRNSRRR